MNSSTRCPMPFIGIDIETNGLVKPCCIYEGSIGNINDQNLDEIWNSQELKQIRNDLESGKKIAGCRQCWVEEKSTNNSKRIRELAQFDDSVYSQPQLKRLDLKLGNTCNLKCRICNYESSSLFNSENQQIKKAYPTVDVRVISKENADRYKWHRNNNFWSDLLVYGAQIEQLDLMGGEPLLDKYHQDILQHLIDQDLAKNITVNYTTNGTIVPDFEVLRKFKQCCFTVSGDAIGKRFEYNRYPAKWDEFVRNLHQIRKQADSILVSYSVSNYSLFGIPDALDYYSAHNFKIWFNYVHLLESSNAQNLLPELKEQFKDIVAARRNEDWKKTGVDIDEVINFIDVQENENEFRKFIKHCQLRDKYRNQDFREYLPEFAPYANLASSFK